MEIGELGMVSRKQQKEGTLRDHLWDSESWRDRRCVSQAGVLCSQAEFLKRQMMCMLFSLYGFHGGTTNRICEQACSFGFDFDDASLIPKKRAYSGFFK